MLVRASDEERLFSCIDNARINDIKRSTIVFNRCLIVRLSIVRLCNYVIAFTFCRQWTFASVMIHSCAERTKIGKRNRDPWLAGRAWFLYKGYLYRTTILFTLLHKNILYLLYFSRGRKKLGKRRLSVLLVSIVLQDPAFSAFLFHSSFSFQQKPICFRTIVIQTSI